VIREFTSMQQNLLSGLCDAATANKDTIARQMFVPFVQGSLRSAYLLDAGSRSETTEAEGTIYAAAVLPVVYSCNQNDAELIFDNMRPGATASFVAVEAAFQENYDCMGIACEDVGGLWDDAKGQYFGGAGPCGVPTALPSVPPPSAPTPVPVALTSPGVGVVVSPTENTATAPISEPVSPSAAVVASPTAETAPISVPVASVTNAPTDAPAAGPAAGPTVDATTSAPEVPTTARATTPTVSSATTAQTVLVCLWPLFLILALGNAA
jgi:hypothetical protein